MSSISSVSPSPTLSLTTELSPQGFSADLDAQREANTSGLVSSSWKILQSLFERSKGPAFEWKTDNVSSLADKVRPYMPSELPYCPCATQKTVKTACGLFISTAMAYCPQHFVPNALETACNFLRDFVGNKLDAWIETLKEQIDAEDETPSEQKEAINAFIDNIGKFLRSVSSGQVEGFLGPLLDEGIDQDNMKNLREERCWLEANKGHSEYKRRYEEFSELKLKVLKQKNKNLEKGVDYLFGLLKKISPALQDAENMGDAIAIMGKKPSRRKEFEEYFRDFFPKEDIFETNNLRKFWEGLYCKQYGPVFYEVVCEALDSRYKESDFHQSALQLWYLSLVDTMNAHPKEARSRMPELSFSGEKSPNWGYDMACSEHYSQWLRNPITRAAGDIVMDGFYWIADFGASLDTETFLDGLEKYLDRQSAFDNPYHSFFCPFLFFLLEKGYGKKFVFDGRHNVIKELKKVSQDRKELLEKAETALKDFKSFAANMQKLRQNDRGLVFGIGFNGNLFDSPLQGNRENNEEIWLTFAKSGRQQSGSCLFLAFLKDLVRCARKEFFSNVLDKESVSRYYNKYNSFICLQVKKEIEEHQESLNPYAIKRCESARTLAEQLQKNTPFENLTPEQQEWIKDFTNWYKVPCEVKAIVDEVSEDEERAHKSAREIFFRAALKRPFSSYYPQLMPTLVAHWKSELAEIMREKEHLLPLIQKVEEGAQLSEEECQRVYPLVDSLVWEIHPGLTKVSEGLSKELKDFTEAKQKPLDDSKKKMEKKIERLKKEREKTQTGRPQLEGAIKEAQADLAKIDDELAAVKKSCFEEFEAKFFERRKVGQCVEPIFAKVLAHPHFFPVYLAKSKPAGGIPDPVDPSTNPLQLGNKHPEYVIAPCNKNCQINALAHLYISDLLREDQGADLLDSSRTTQSMEGVPERIWPVEKFWTRLLSSAQRNA